ncbi:MAG: hypothetical protein SNJ72_06000 [Fimbriimonadales bacterium]
MTFWRKLGYNRDDADALLGTVRIEPLEHRLLVRNAWAIPLPPIVARFRAGSLRESVRSAPYFL